MNYNFTNPVQIQDIISALISELDAVDDELRSLVEVQRGKRETLKQLQSDLRQMNKEKA